LSAGKIWQCVPASTSLPDAFAPGGGRDADDVGCAATECAAEECAAVGCAAVECAAVACAELAVVRATAVGVPDFEAAAAVDAVVDAAVIDEAGAGVDAVGSAVGLAARCDRASQAVARMAKAAIRVPAAALGVCLMPHLRPAAP
jgi:hypothetical protein